MKGTQRTQGKMKIQAPIAEATLEGTIPANSYEIICMCSVKLNTIAVKSFNKYLMASNLHESSVVPQEHPESTMGMRFRNLLIVLVAIALSIALFLGLRTETNSASLATLDKQSTPLEVALSNGKPTLMEFYADWCTSCQAMAPDMAKLKQQYPDSVNFVMLNVDNTKWLPEILKYRVDGIPDFVFLNKDGVAIATTIGEQPRTIMAKNLDALIASLPLPYAQSGGQVSKFEAPVAPNGEDDPRLHGSQVVN